MKKFLVIVLGVCLWLSLSSCGDEYAAEKEMWWAQKMVKELLANPEASPPGQFELVANRFRNIIAKYPEWPGKVKAQWAVAEIYIAQKNFKQAENELEKFIAEHSDNQEFCAQAKATIGSIYELQNDWEKALKIYQELFNDYPYTSPGLNQPLYVAAHYHSLKNFFQADTAYQEASNKYEAIVKSEAPNKVKAVAQVFSLRAQFALATVYEQEEKWEEALAILKKILTEFPYSQEGLEVPLYIANHYKRKGEEAQVKIYFDEALKHYNEIYEKNSKNPLGLAALSLIATGYLNQNNWNEAIKIQEKIVAEYPEAPGIPLTLLNIALIYEQGLKDKEKAMATYKRLLEKYPRHRLAAVAKKKISELIQTK